MSRAGRGVKGGVNRVIDRVMHPYFRDYPVLMLLDGLLHAVVEQELKKRGCVFMEG